MAEPIGLASGVLALATFAFQSTITLHNMVQSFSDHPKRVRDLIEELEALSGVLGPLAETIANTDDANLSALDRPLLRCGKACDDFRQELLKCATQSGRNQLTFRGWAKLRYMGDDVDGFRRLLAGYKLTMNVALTNANLRASSATTEALESYKNLVQVANNDLQAHLEDVNDKLEMLLATAATTGTESDAAETEAMREERLSTQQCLAICDQLSKQIDDIQLATRRWGGLDTDRGSDSVPEMLINEGLQGCKETLGSTVEKLQKHEGDVYRRLMERMNNAISSEGDRADIARLRDEWESARQSLSICSEANNRLKQNISVIKNYATGDATQFMVSTNGKTLHGENRGLGWRTRQVGGYLSDDTVRQVSRDMITSVVMDTKRARTRTNTDADAGPDAENKSEFGSRYGRGFSLTPKSTGNPQQAGSSPSS